MENINARALSTRISFDDKYRYTRRQQEEAGIGDLYYELQPYSMPKVEKVSLVLGLMFAANSLWTNLALLFGGTKVNLLNFLMAKT